MKLANFVPETFKKPVAAGLMATSFLAGGQDGLTEEPRIENRSNAIQLAEAKIPQRRIDGSTWDAHPNDVDEYLESVLLNASDAGVLKSIKDFENRRSNRSQVENEFRQYIDNWKTKARNFERPGNLSSFLYGLHILRGKGDESKRVISDEQVEALLLHHDVKASHKLVNELYGYIVHGSELSLVRKKAGEKISNLISTVASTR